MAEMRGGAVERAFELLGAEGYEAMCLEVLVEGGVLVQTGEFVLAFFVRAGVAEVVFACGDLRRIFRFAKENAAAFGYERAAWVRSLVGKRKERRIYDIERL